MDNNNCKYKIFNRDMMKYLAVFIMFWGHLIGWSVQYKYGDIEEYYTLPLWEYIIIYTSLLQIHTRQKKICTEASALCLHNSAL